MGYLMSGIICSAFDWLAGIIILMIFYYLSYKNHISIHQFIHLFTMPYL